MAVRVVLVAVAAAVAAAAASGTIRDSVVRVALVGTATRS
jgi:hypothetical protein